MTLKRKTLSRQEAEKRIFRYCAYQERSHLEVRNKLRSYGLPELIVDEVMYRLIQENFLNEERFARSFAGGRFRMKHWGKNKIAVELARKGLTEKCISLGLSEIRPEDYRITLIRLLREKNELLTESDIYARRNKLSKYVIQKGYEPDVAWETILELFPK